jgi:hypothetical protein
MKKGLLWALVGYGIALLIPPASVLGIFRPKAS